MLNGGTELASLQTYWDAAGNLTRRTNWTMPDGSSVEDLLFRYDARHRLTAVLQPSSGNGWGNGPAAFYGTGSYAAYTASYEYDASGRMTTKNEPGSSASMTYSGANPVHAPKTVALNGAPAEAMTYDVNGNLLTGRGRTLSYDPQQRARSVTSGSVTTYYWYDADGRPVLRDEVHTNGTVTKTLLVGSLYEEDVTPGGAKQDQVVTYYVFGSQRVGQRTKRVAEGVDEFRYLVGDYLGSQAATTDASGNVVSRVSYLPYGGIRLGSQTGAFGFTDQRLEGHGLQYFGNGSGYGRFYDSAIGVWTQGDRLAPRMGGEASAQGSPLAVYSSDPREVRSASVTGPQGGTAAAHFELNRYRYAQGSPLGHVDRDGHCPGGPPAGDEVGDAPTQLMCTGVGNLPVAGGPRIPYGTQLAFREFGVPNRPPSRTGTGKGGAKSVLQGQAGVQRAIEEMTEFEASRGNTVIATAEVWWETPSGRLTRLDAAVTVIDRNGAIVERRFLTEVKNGADADLSANQRAAFEELQTVGGTPFGLNAERAGYVPGRFYGPDSITIVVIYYRDAGW